MTKPIAVFLGIILWATPMVFAAEAVRQNAPAQDPAVLLQKTAEEIRRILHEMDESLKAAKAELSATGIQGKEARAVLQKLYKANPYAFDCATIDPDGIIVDVAPQEMSFILGADISHQEQIKRLLKTHEPVMSTAINTVEGFVAFDLEHPVLDPKGRFIGSVSVLTKPDFFGSVIGPTVARFPVEMWMLQKDGRIIYDINPEEIGRNLFTDRLYADYPSLITVGRKMAGTAKGRGHYVFLHKNLQKEVRKEVIWTTVALHKTEFRLALAYEMKDFEE
ncbi:MAG: PDC sensor domain-containing protein [Desulfobacteraceae bacterium]